MLPQKDLWPSDFQTGPSDESETEAMMMKSVLATSLNDYDAKVGDIVIVQSDDKKTVLNGLLDASNFPWSGWSCASSEYLFPLEL